MRLPAFVCLSVCRLARLLKYTCMDLDEILRVDRYDTIRYDSVYFNHQSINQSINQSEKD